jgi:hypothetical protein
MPIAQADGGRTIANLLRASFNPRRGEMGHVPIHRSLSIGWHTRPPIGPIFD